MKKEEILALFNDFESAVCITNETECWSARELCSLLGYSQWRNFVNVIDKAKVSCVNVGHNVMDHFADVSKMIKLAKGAVRQVNDTFDEADCRAGRAADGQRGALSLHHSIAGLLV